MGRSPSKRKKSAANSPSKRSQAASTRKAVSRSPSKRGPQSNQHPSRINRTVPGTQLKGPAKPRRCRQCVGSPLLTSSACIHSKVYGDKHRFLVNAGVEVPPGITYTQMEELTRDLEAERRGVTPLESNESHHSPQATEVLNIEQSNVASATAHPYDHSPFHTPIRPNRGGGSNRFQSFTLDNPHISNGQHPPQVESPVLNQPYSESFNHPPDFARQSPLPPSSPLGDLQSQATVSSPVTQTSSVSTPTAVTQPSSSPYKPRRNRATQKDPLFGRVRGAAKGSQPWNIVRDRPVPTPRSEVAESTRRYRRELEKIICRCERLGEETGCWLYLAAQHPNAHESFAHYTSRRLTLDWIPTLDNVHNETNKLFVSLQRSRRSNAAELSADLIAKEAALSEALAETSDLRTKNQQLEEQHQRLLQEVQCNSELIRELEAAREGRGELQLVQT